MIGLSRKLTEAQFNDLFGWRRQKLFENFLTVRMA